MIKACITALFVCLMACSEPSKTEHAVLLNEQTHAIYHPSSVSTPKATVLMLHGWTGTLNEVGNLYQRLANDLAKQGIASIRVQMRGEFNTPGFRLTSTFNSRVEDATNGLDYLLTQHPNANIGVVGFSLGGATAIALAGKQAKHIDSMVLWSTAVNPNEVIQLLSPDHLSRIKELGETTIESYVPFVFTKTHFEGLLGHDQQLKKFSAYEGSLLMLRGSEDFLDQHEPTILKSSQARPAEYRIIKGADHIFNVLDDSSSYDDRVLNATTDWFVQYLLNTPKA